MAELLFGRDRVEAVEEKNDHGGWDRWGCIVIRSALARYPSTSGVERAGRTSCASLPPMYAFSLTSSPFFGIITLWTCVRSVLVGFVRSTHFY